jgi:L-fuculose-phosphate aldolase
MNYLQLRREIIDAARQVMSSGLSIGKSGNLSARTRKGCLITPSGIAYDQLMPEDLIELDREGQVLSGRLTPSSEWRFHKAIYSARPEINAIVHVHSAYATAVACTRQSIPALHYHIALAGGSTIHCADYATFGTSELSVNAVNALTDRQACLLANHGQIALGDSIVAAINMACEVEQLAKLFCLARLAGQPVLLDEDEIQINIDKFSRYGQQDT